MVVAAAATAAILTCCVDRDIRQTNETSEHCQLLEVWESLTPAPAVQRFRLLRDFTKISSQHRFKQIRAYPAALFTAIPVPSSLNSVGNIVCDSFLEVKSQI